MKFLAKMKEKQMQRKIGGILCGLLCAGGWLVIPSAWAAPGPPPNFYGTADGIGTTDVAYSVTHDGKVSLAAGSYYEIYGGYNDDDPGQRVYKNQILPMPQMLFIMHMEVILNMVMLTKTL